MDDDPWADSPSTPKLPSSPAPAASSPSAITKSNEHDPADTSSEIDSIHSPSKLGPDEREPALAPEEEAGVVGGDEGAFVADAQESDLGSPPAPREAAAALIEAEETSQAEDGKKADEDDGFDDFDDFGDTLAGPSGSSTNRNQDVAGAGAGADMISAGRDDDDDAFGDFGDFEEGDFDESESAQPGVEPVETAARVGTLVGGELVGEPFQVEERWHALSLRPFPPRGELIDQLSTLLAPLYDDEKSRQYLTDEQPRMVGGLSQVLVAESSRDAYAQLTTAPMLKPLDWTRSRVRREHLISMGVPVNLDEVDSHRLSALPSLRITTGAAFPQARRAESLDTNSYSNGNRYTSAQKGKGRDLSPNTNAASSVPHSAGAGRNPGSGRYGLGGRPDFDLAKAEDFCGLEEDRLSLLSVPTLRRMQAEIAETSAQASALLAWSLQLKDAQTQDSNTYNGMISELIANAAKVKSAQATGGGVFRRSSTKRPQSVSGTVTPRRTGSPGMW
ncbi:hypothetical protein I316_03421 [Kwoniella heveanensis BCC8398]|uniref:Uncharacterized protein n=1 Tax=Kwoniella heveanensis BCC8398 TaxID=1296120 RepID=A0A1B9GV10_9TREE|nr:hypothetical protein I316_03421 [Kwoniella heveanensis BCC8398]